MPRKISVWVVAVFLTGASWAASLGIGESFNDEAHKILSTRAINPGVTNSSTLDAFLKDVLSFEFSQGINENLLGSQDGTVAGQIRVGAVREDQGLRPARHFHDPTKTWDLAGLFTTFESSVRWSQNPAQSPGEPHSWKDARDAYFNVLTSTNPALRKAWYA